MSKQRAGVRIHLGEFEGIKLGARRFDLRDPYYVVLTIPWSAFFCVAISFYLSMNLCFALAYYAVPGCVNNARPDHFADSFFFSIETLATVGYGVMSPASLYGHLIASTEIIVGMMSMAVITGLVFVRFSRPRARLLFTRHAVVAPYEGGRALMTRVVNERHQVIAEATARMTLLRRFVNADGHVLRRFVDLRMERSTAPFLGLSWTLIHIINENSPLYGSTAESLLAEGCTLLISVSGYDESISSAVTARKTYQAQDLLFEHRFVDIMDQLPTGEIVLDLNHFHETIPAPSTPPP